MKLTKIIRRFRIDKPDKFRLSDYDPGDTCGVDIEKAEAKAMLADGIERLAHLQEKLYAQNRWAVLAVFQAMDAAGKDGEYLVRIEQGYEMGRPSLMELTLKISSGKLSGASIGGSAVIVTEGTIEA